jgi:hypothetical protein
MKTPKWMALSLAVLLLGSLFSFARPAHAGHDKTLKIASYGLGALAVYNLAKGKEVTGIVLGAGAYLANKEATRASRRHRRERFGRDRF